MLGIPTFLAHQNLADKKDARTALEQHNEKLQASIDSKADLKAAAAEVETLDAKVASLLKNDVSWSHMLQGVAKTMPANVWLTSFQGQVTIPAPAAAAAPTPDTSNGESADSASTAPAPAPTAPAGLQGQVTFAAKSTSFVDIASWLKSIGDPTIFPSLQGLWVSSATASAATDAAPTVDFASAGERLLGAQQSLDEVPRRSPMTAGRSA